MMMRTSLLTVLGGKGLEKEKPALDWGQSQGPDIVRSTVPDIVPDKVWLVAQLHDISPPKQQRDIAQQFARYM